MASCESRRICAASRAWSTRGRKTPRSMATSPMRAATTIPSVARVSWRFVHLRAVPAGGRLHERQEVDEDGVGVEGDAVADEPGGHVAEVAAQEVEGLGMGG